MARTSYPERLGIPLTGDETTSFTSRTGVLLATGYNRIVIGGRGPYVEFSMRHLLYSKFFKVEASHRYYVELRSTQDNVKLYDQREQVDYADYVPGLYYISPFDLMVGGKRIITELRQRAQTNV